jgi:putative addiction module CopG family antidote
MYYIMRSILNISLPEEMAKEIKREVKAGQFSSVSEFIRAAVRAYDTERALRISRRAEKAYREGKLRKVGSFGELRNLR